MSSTQPRTQRKRAANAPLHTKRIMASSHLAPEIHDKSKAHLPRALPVRKGDTVRIMRGGFRGKEGKVVSVDRVHGTVVIEGITIEKVDEKKVARPLHASNLLIGRGVRVDGRAVTDPKFPVGLMDVLSFAATKAHYRMLVDTRGRMALVPIEEGDAKWKLCRVEDKTTVRRGKTQVNLHDGRNVLLEKDAYKTGATLKLHVPEQKLVKAQKVLELVTKQKSVQTLSHQAVRDWGVRRNMPIGTRVTLRGGPAEAFLAEALSIRNNRLPAYSFDSNGNFSFGIQDYTDFRGMKYDPEIGVFGMDVSVSLQRPGWRGGRRSNKSRRITRRHPVSRDEGMEFMEDRFKVEVVTCTARRTLVGSG